MSCSQDDPNWIPRINTNGVYTYYPTYAETYVAYNKPTVMPVLFLEENYEDENNLGEPGTPFVLRHQEVLVSHRRRFGRTYVRKLLDRQVRPCVATAPKQPERDRVRLFQEFLHRH